MVSFRVRV